MTDRNTRLAYSTGGEAEKPLSKDAGPSSAGTARGGIRIRLERRASDRIVTVVTGLPGGPQAVATLARALKSACGAGGAVKEGALELQGDQRDRVEAALAARGLRFKRSGG